MSAHASSSLPLVVGITGASGAPYAVRLLQALLDAGREVHLSISPSGQAVILEETGVRIDLDRFEPETLLGVGRPAPGLPPLDRLRYFHHKNLMAPIASGSHLTAGMVICPCSGSTLSAVAHSMGENLIHRAAEVHLKERRKLVVVPRETPLSLPQLKNMQAIHEAGAVVLPASPGFYHGADTVADLVDFVVARICDQLGVAHSLMRRWGETT
ncbi:MAG: UbiX family flavin prenyltransferase [Planctomycetia bacterium]